MGIYLTQPAAYVQNSHRALAHQYVRIPSSQCYPNHCHNIIHQSQSVESVWRSLNNTCIIHKSINRTVVVIVQLSHRNTFRQNFVSLSCPGPYLPSGRIWDVMLVWRKGSRPINKTVSVLQYFGAQWYEQFLQEGRLDRALILLRLALSSEHLCIFGLHGAI